MSIEAERTGDHQPGADDLSARLALKKTAGGPRGLLDGAWWPRSRDLSRELPALVEALDPLWGRVTRASVNPRYWLVVPRKVGVRGRVMKVGWFAEEQDPHKILLFSYTSARWDLLVVPPESGAASAERLMAAASDEAGPPLTASALMASEEAHQGAPEPDTAERSTAGQSTAGHSESGDTKDEESEGAWEGEGGAI
jgi:Family of unknown function (DUF5994)